MSIQTDFFMKLFAHTVISKVKRQFVEGPDLLSFDDEDFIFRLERLNEYQINCYVMISTNQGHFFKPIGFYTSYSQEPVSKKFYDDFRITVFKEFVPD